MNPARPLCVALALAVAGPPAALAAPSYGGIVAPTGAAVRLSFETLDPIPCGGPLCPTPAGGWEIGFEIQGEGFGSLPARADFGPPVSYGAITLFGSVTTFDLWADYGRDGPLPGSSGFSERFAAVVSGRPFPAGAAFADWPAALTAFADWLALVGGFEGDFSSPYGSGPLALALAPAPLATPAPGSRILLASVLPALVVLGRRGGA